MLKAKFTIIDQWDNSRILKNEIMEFDTLSELEHFFAYNRAYILKLSFTGEFNKEVN